MLALKALSGFKDLRVLSGRRVLLVHKVIREMLGLLVRKDLLVHKGHRVLKDLLALKVRRAQWDIPAPKA
jgi:hypothetical protein